MIALRLEPPIEVDTPAGRGYAIIWRDYGYDHDDLWTCVIAETKQFWTYRNKDIRAVDNVTFGVGQLADIAAANLRGSCSAP